MLCKSVYRSAVNTIHFYAHTLPRRCPSPNRSVIWDKVALVYRGRLGFFSVVDNQCHHAEPVSGNPEGRACET